MFPLETWEKCVNTEEDTRDRNSRGEGGRRGMEREKEGGQRKHENYFIILS